MSDFPVAVPFVIVVSFHGLNLKLISDFQDRLDSVVGF